LKEKQQIIKALFDYRRHLRQAGVPRFTMAHVTHVILDLPERKSWLARLKEKLGVD